MAPRRPEPVPRPAAAALVENNVLPPSTIAAQIVHHHSENIARREPEKKALFGQLLQEYLRDPTAEELDAHLNGKLIDVVAEAGLDVLLRDNLFDQHVLLPQAVDSLSVIKLTIQRSSELLLSARSEGRAGSPSPFLRLLPKLISLLGRSSLLSIQNDLKDVLSECVKVTVRNLDSWRDALPLIRLYQSCVDCMYFSPSMSRITHTIPGILISLGSLRSVHQALNPSFEAVLPPSQGISYVWPESQHLVALPQGCQVNVSSPVQGIIIALDFISVILNSIPSSKGYLLGGYQYNIAAWAFESCNRLWYTFKPIKTFAQPQDLAQQAETLYLETLNQTMLYGGADYQIALSEKSTIILLDSLSDLLHICCCSSERRPLEVNLVWCLLHLLWHLSRSASEDPSQGPANRFSRQLVSERLRPALYQVARHKAWFNNLTKDLQVQRA